MNEYPSLASSWAPAATYRRVPEASSLSERHISLGPSPYGHITPHIQWEVWRSRSTVVLPPTSKTHPRVRALLLAASASSRLRRVVVEALPGSFRPLREEPLASFCLSLASPNTQCALCLSGGDPPFGVARVHRYDFDVFDPNPGGRSVISRRWHLVGVGASTAAIRRSASPSDPSPVSSLARASITAGVERSISSSAVVGIDCPPRPRPGCRASMAEIGPGSLRP